MRRGEKRRETSRGGEGVCTLCTYVLRKSRFDESDFQFNFGTISLMCTSDDLENLKRTKSHPRARARWRVLRGKKNCARKSGMVERITLINWARKIYLLTLYWEWRIKVSANLCSKWRSIDSAPSFRSHGWIYRYYASSLKHLSLLVSRSYSFWNI